MIAFLSINWLSLGIVYAAECDTNTGSNLSCCNNSTPPSWCEGISAADIILGSETTINTDTSDTGNFASDEEFTANADENEVPKGEAAYEAAGIDPILSPNSSQIIAPDKKQILSENQQKIKDIPECMTEDEQREYITVTIEEPLTLKNEGAPGDNYFSRVCYRNTLSIVDKNYNNEEKIYKLKTNCADIESLIADDYILTYTCTPVQVLFSRGGTTLLEGYVRTIYRYGASIAGIIAVVVIVVSGVQISASMGETDSINNAKKRITKSILGIIVLFLSAVILYTINPNFFTNTRVPDVETYSSDQNSNQ